MLDKSIPYSPVYMVRLPAPLPELPRLPQGYSYRLYQAGDAEAWAELQTVIGSFDTVDKAQAYFEKEYLAEPELLQKRFGVIAAGDGSMAANASAWEKGDHYLFHWLATFPQHQGKGLGTAALLYALHLFPDRNKPVLLHTQTNSHVAIRMYDKLGFRFVRSDVPGNAYEKTVEILYEVMENETLSRMTAEAVELPREITL